MPPEQFGARTVPASDLYSLGATLITLATGTHPADLPQTDLLIKFEQAANLSAGFADWLRWMIEPSLNKRLTSAQEALKALENEQQRDSLVSARKPFGSKVILTKNVYSLEILSRSIGFSIRRVMSGWQMFLAYTSGSLFLTISTPFFGNLNVFLVLLLIIRIQILWGRFKQTRLHIDRQQISLTNEFFGFKRKLLRSVQRRDILSLNRPDIWSLNSPTQYQYPVLILLVGTKKIVIGGDGRLTKPEIDWLAQELSDYLEMPITKSVE